MGTKHEEITGNGCLAKAEMDEPIFVLRAQDVLAPAIVRAWAREAALIGTPEAKCREALALAERMEAWQRTVKRKVPD